MPSVELVESFTIADLELVEQRLAELEFREFIAQAWPILEPATPFLQNWHIDSIAEHLQALTEGQLRRLIINVPPGSAKSILVSVMWPVWHWLHQPADRFLTASYTDALSIRDAIKSRRLLTSIWYQSRWGDRFALTGDMNTKSKYENDKTGFRLATHVGGATGERARVRILDDPHEIEQAQSDQIRESTIEWVRTTWAERESDPRTSIDVVVMQRLHERDVSGFLLEEVGGFEHLCIPMRFEPSRKFHTSVWPQGDPRTVEGELLFPDRWSAEDVTLKERRLGTYGASGQLQQRPAPDEGGILKRHWWRYWHYPNHPLPPVVMKTKDGHETIPCIELPYHFDQYLQSWDMSFKGHDGSDYVVGQQWAKLNADAYLLDQVRDRQDFVGTKHMVKAFNEQWDVPGQKLVEDKANGPAIVSSLKTEIPGIVMYPVLGGDKIARARAYAPYVEAGNIFLPHPQLAPWVHDFIQECSMFPNAQNDDQVDAFSQSMSKLYAPEPDVVPITPEYHPQFHLLPSPREATKGALVTSFRFWHDGLYPTCILGQVTPDRQRILVLDCVQMENASLEELIDRKVIPVMKAHYQGVGQWRDIGNYRALHAKSSAIEHLMATLISEKLGGMLEPGEADFFQRVTAIKTVLGQTGRMLVNPRPSLGESKMLVHEALLGGYAYKTDAKTNAVSQAEARPFHPLTAVGEALGHGLARVFVRRPVTEPEERTPMSERQKRASGYAVGGRKR